MRFDLDAFDRLLMREGPVRTAVLCVFVVLLAWALCLVTPPFLAVIQLALAFALALAAIVRGCIVYDVFGSDAEALRLEQEVATLRQRLIEAESHEGAALERERMAQAKMTDVLDRTVALLGEASTLAERNSKLERSITRISLDQVTSSRSMPVEVVQEMIERMQNQIDEARQEEAEAYAALDELRQRSGIDAHLIVAAPQDSEN